MRASSEGLVKLNVVVTGVPRETKVKDKMAPLQELYRMCVYLLLSCLFFWYMQVF